MIPSSKTKLFVVMMGFALVLAGCFENLKKAATGSSGNTSSASQSLISPDDFLGAMEAKNLVSGIQISWILSKKEASNYRIYRVLGQRLSFIGTVAGSVNSFIDGAITYGTIYSYIVRAADANGVEETNIRQVSALAWGGILNVISEGRTSVTINFLLATPVADKINIYLKPAGSTSPKTLVKTVTGSEVSVQLTGLKPGYSYELSAQAYVNSLKREDGNLVVFAVSTLTEGYHRDVGLGDEPHWRNIVNVRAFGASLGTQPHPVDSLKQPNERQVELYFNSFRGMDASTKYVVIRTADDGRKIDTSNGAASMCTADSLNSCVPSNPVPCLFLVSGGLLTCIDKSVAPSPAKYLYTLALIHSNSTEEWVEPFPMEYRDNFAVRVQIPPDRMVLVHRNAVNNEMCQLMNKTSDPLNYNRCVYSGIGDRPFSSGHGKPPLNLPVGFYDFGYNLFVDRYNLGCQWTKAPEGKCGAGGTDGDCLGFVASSYSGTKPLSSLGVDGNVFWMMTTSAISGNYYISNQCFIKIAGQWKSPQEVVVNYANPELYLKKLFTTDATLNDQKIPPFTGAHFSLWPMGANLACNAMEDPNYGPKRIPRMREYRAYSAFPSSSLINEPFAMPYAKLNSWMFQATLHNPTNGYGCNANKSLLSDVYPTTVAELLAPTNRISILNTGGLRYGAGSFLGTNFTADCQSRYGVNDFSDARVVSDYFYYYYTLSPKRIIGGASPIDDGNRDFLKDIASGLDLGLRFDMTTFQTTAYDYYTGLASNPNQNYVALPLGMPVFLSSSTDYLPRAQFIENYGGSFTPVSMGQVINKSQVMHVSGRWGTYGSAMSNWEASNGAGEDWMSPARIQCVLPAE